MARSRRPAVTQSPNDVLFIAAPLPESGEGRLHASVGAGIVTKPLKLIRENWKVAVKQVEEIIASTEFTPKAGYDLTEFTVSLGFSAEGKFFFVASAGVEASISLSFRKP